MRLTRLRAELRSQRYGIAIGIIALLVAVGAPARALEGTTSAVSSMAKALKIAKKADKRSKKALRLVKSADKTPGPRGPQGPAGSDAQFNGATAGGDLAGTYPKPNIAPNAIGSAEVTDDTLSGNDIAEGGLAQVPAALNSTFASFASTVADGSITASSFGPITQRSDTDVILGGGTAENGNYDTGFKEILCLNDELALAGSAEWVSVGGSDDEELWISEFSWIYDASTGQPNGLHVTGGNDTGASKTLKVEVACLAP